MNKLLSKRKAQSLTEYLLLICLLTVASIPIVSILANVLRDRIEVSAQRIGGKAAEPRAEGYLKNASQKVHRGLDNFWKQ